MKIYNKRDDALEIVRRLKKAGHTAYWVGGCVRDMLRGMEPEDYDIATTARPEQVRRLFRNTVAVGESFGVILVIKRRTPFEVAAFRVDDSYSDGRRPDNVRFCSPEEDAKRRDFTVNGMYYDPIEERVIDYVGGQADLKAGIIRAIGDPEARFGEDKLRLMRAARFAALLGFEVEERTRLAIAKHAGEIALVSAERIRDEIVKILSGPRPRMGIELLSGYGLLGVVLPEVEAMKGVRQPPQFHPEGDVWTHTMILLDNLPEQRESELAMAALLHDVGKPPTYAEAERIRFDGHTTVGAEMAAAIMRRLRFSRKQQDLVESLVREHLKFMEASNMRMSTLKRFMRLDRFDLHLEIHRLDCIASHGDLDNYHYVKNKLKEFDEAEKEQALRPRPIITGNDLIAMRLTPGPLFKEILEAVEDAQLEGRISSREDAIRFVNDYIKARRF